MPTMSEKNIKFSINGTRYVSLRFVLENDTWVCRATIETMDDLEKIVDHIGA